MSYERQFMLPTYGRPNFVGILDQMSTKPDWAVGFRVLTESMIGQPIFKLEEDAGGTQDDFSIAKKDMVVISGYLRGVGTPRNSSGQTVAEWLTASGASAARVHTMYPQRDSQSIGNATQATDAAQPAYDATYSQLNDRPAMTGDGTDSHVLSTGDCGTFHEGECAIAAVCRSQNTSGDTEIICTVDIDVSNNRSDLEMNRTDNKLSTIVSSTAESFDITTGSTNHGGTGHIGMLKRTGAVNNWTNKLYLDGALDATESGITVDPPTAASKVSLLALQTKNGEWHGGLSEVLMWDSAAAAADLNLYGLDAQLVYATPTWTTIA